MEKAEDYIPLPFDEADLLKKHPGSTVNMSAASHQELADYLITNYANVSLSRVNPDRGLPDREAEHKLIFERVFGNTNADQLEPKRRFSRNIVIIGARVSEEAFGFFKDGEGTIKMIEENVAWTERWDADEKRADGTKKNQGEKHFRNLYMLHANTYLRAAYDESQIILVKRRLGMEGRLAVLEKMYDPRTIRRELNKLIYHRHFPSTTYEMLAHMFKHRLIDVLVNLNFDELLDNAIEDEMGDGTMKRVTPENVLENLDDLFTHHRLRYPIYIKPHGTASQFSSLAYTEEHYVEMSSTMQKVLLDVFSGLTGTDQNKASERTAVVNVVTLGYGYKDLDMKRILFDAIADHKQGQYNLFLSSRTPVERFNEFSAEFSNYLVDRRQAERPYTRVELKAVGDQAKVEAIHVWPRYVLVDAPKDEKADDSKLTKVPKVVGEHAAQRVRLHPLYVMDEHPRPYDHDLTSVYAKADLNLKDPFGIGRPTRHELLVGLITRPVAEAVHRAVSGTDNAKGKEKMRAYYALRSQFHMVYDFFKHGGCMPYSVFQSERAGKYYELYLEAHGGEDRYMAESMQKLAQAVLGEGFQYFPDHCGLEADGVADLKGRADHAAAALIHFARSIGPTQEEVRSEEFSEHAAQLTRAQSALATALKSMGNHRHFEITPKLYDPKYGRFHAYDTAQIIFTNLHLTYQFYAMFKELGERNGPVWDELWFSSDSARALYNLFHYADGDTNLLSRASVASVKLRILAKDSVVPFDIPGKRLKEHLLPPEKTSMVRALRDELLSGCATKGSPGSPMGFRCPTSPANHLHHMALFFHEGVPQMGLYLFKPSTRNRINPVYFDLTGRFFTEEQRNWSERDEYGDKLAAFQTSTTENLDTMRKLFDHEFRLGGPHSA